MRSPSSGWGWSKEWTASVSCHREQNGGQDLPTLNSERPDQLTLRKSGQVCNKYESALFLSLVYFSYHLLLLLSLFIPLISLIYSLSPLISLTCGQDLPTLNSERPDQWTLRTPGQACNTHESALFLYFSYHLLLALFIPLLSLIYSLSLLFSLSLTPPLICNTYIQCNWNRVT